MGATEAVNNAFQLSDVPYKLISIEQRSQCKFKH